MVSRTRKTHQRGVGKGLETVEQLPWRRVSNRYPPIEPLSEDEVEYIHSSSLDILEQVGIEIMLPEARKRLASAGADVSSDSDIVFFDRGMVEECLKSTRSSFIAHARNSRHNLEMGTDQICFATVGSAPHASDLDNGRRTGNQEDFRKFLKLAQHLNIIHMMGGYPVEPVDVHAAIRHLECLRDFVLLTDKLFYAYSLGRQRNLDALEIIKIARGIDDEQLDREPSIFTVINSNSPLRLDSNMCQGIIEMSLRNQIVVLTPFTLSGAMAPVSLAGAIAQQNAEVLAGLAISQTARPGAPFVYGEFTSNVDMRSGAPAFGTPEYMKTALASGQMARKYKLPLRSSNANAANAVDAQSAYESVFSLWGSVNAHSHIILHGAGWMEGGLTASFEKFVIDADMLQMVAEYLEPIRVNDDEIAIEAMKQAGHGGHFFGTDHTQSRYRTAFYSPMISDWRNFETWSEAGAPQAVEHANKLYKRLLAEYEEPPIDPAIRDELNEFVDRRIAEGGVTTDF